MFRKKFLTMIVLVALVFVPACGLAGGQTAVGGTNQGPSIPIETQVAVIVASTLAAQTLQAIVETSTQAAQTLQAIAETSTQAAQTLQAIAETSTQAALVTSTPEFTLTPSFTPTQTPSLTPAGPMVTVTVSANTNCRTGPTTAYGLLGVMKVGEKAEVVGRSTLTETMIIKLPSDVAITCWLWAHYATVTGDISGLPVIPVPPTPAPKFTATPPVTFNAVYVSTDFCDGSYRIKFKITNTGSLTWESDQVTVTDQNTSTTKTVTWDNFPYYSSACAPGLDLNLEAGELGYTTSDGFAVDPAGHNMVAVIRVCSQNGMAGTCQEKTVTFKP